MRILVTGGDGQLGNEFKLLAAAKTHHSFTFVDLADLDITNEPAVICFFEKYQFDFVVNCAAYTAVDVAEENEAVANKVNSEAVRFIATACKRHGTRLFHVSTDYVYDGAGNQPINEDSATNPVSVYGRSKLSGDIHAMNILDNVYIIRTAWVYSTFGKNFVKTISKLARERSSLNVIADQFGSPTHAGDLALAIFQLIEKVDGKERDMPGIYHFSNEGSISWYDFAWFIVNHYGLPCQIVPISTAEYKTLATRPKFSVLDKRKIRTTFNISVPHWYQSLQRCLSEM